nr:RNA-dependent RNA polymerase [Picobirnavirus sp.]QWW18621.1 RNA-dependent RNA polymerase [Picobirnavirus sp.]QWW18622.1 RNA-dependent RNA polymerase [Picobirnavirus sp.]UBR88999.1 RNA-dependent RNA polymerase [Picobirnavirus sp.]
MMTKLTKQEREIISNNDNLRRYLESLLRGRKATPRSWLYEQIQSPEEVLAIWKTHLSTLENGTKEEQEVYQFDTSQEAKWGPQGEVKPITELMDIVTAGFGESPTPKAFSSQAWKNAKNALTALLKRKGIEALRPASYKRVVDDMRARDTLESNSGWPLFQRRSKPEVKEASIRDAESGAWKDYPAIALFRNYNLKTRLVWMFPMSANLVEGSYFQVLQSALINHNFLFLSPWVGFDRVRTVIGWTYNAERKFIAASDFSSTDAHFRLSASLEVYDVIAPLFQARYRKGLRESLVHMHTIPLVISPDEKLVGDHGVSSGSNWTNFIETIFDWIVSIYCAEVTGLGYEGLYAIGDDMSWVSSRYDESFSDVLERIGEDVGQVIKAEKTTNERDKVKSLQRLFQRGYNRPDGDIRGVYPTIRALKSSVYPERFHDPRRWSADMFCARQFMILENCVDHPLFEEFVKFVCKGQRDLIPFAKQSRPALDRILRKTKLLPGLNPTYNQERRDHSFADFESIRIASEL